MAVDLYRISNHEHHHKDENCWLYSTWSISYAHSNETTVHSPPRYPPRPNPYDGHAPWVYPLSLEVPLSCLSRPSQDLSSNHTLSSMKFLPSSETTKYSTAQCDPTAVTVPLKLAAEKIAQYASPASRAASIKAHSVKQPVVTAVDDVLEKLVLNSTSTLPIPAPYLKEAAYSQTADRRTLNIIAVVERLARAKEAGDYKSAARMDMKTLKQFAKMVDVDIDGKSGGYWGYMVDDRVACKGRKVWNLG
ncbi:uncharacterized protein BDZ99DRAFT_481393 [Mytilinidion resinicola]|uniref:Uncharacterized protein n=1 Tax=Mytilinidion resinicola TaxID=574789 RepID=A0A6A6Y8D8_9PEZI|nr:uncharacterized protein BDZ99DRAFT_481393 [Mytilinidion resinicola]KAF2804234.1 hypothetical protein BDZ99DRAFT_481393 [Mytilinidion resinicola]